MQTETFKIAINAPREKVWQTLWEDATYRAWTEPFAPGSRAVTDWQKGSKILFVDEKNDGMLSTVADVIPNEYMSIKHLGVVNKGVENMESKEAQEWGNSFENYTLKAVNGQTEVIVEMSSEKGIPAEYKDYFTKTWPIALQKLKEIAEN